MDNQSASSFTANATAFLAATSSRLGWRHTLREKLYSLWLGLMLLAIIGAGFALSYLAYARLVSHGTATSVETYWD